MSNTKLVFSTDPKDKVTCSKCGKLTSDCKCKVDQAVPANFTAIFRIEKNGRGGKTVTVLDGLPANDKFLSNLCKELKSNCGTGGTYVLKSPHSQIEIQGDKREQIKKILTAKNIKFKGMI